MKKINYWSLLSIIMMAMLSVCFVSCGDDEDDIACDAKTIYVGTKTSIDGAKSVVSNNKFVALINDDKSIEGWHVGETTVTVNGKYKVSVSVRGLYHFYNDPVIEWGCNQTYVKQHQTQGTLSSKSDSESLIFENVGSADVMLYQFENGKLVSVAALVKTTYTSRFMDYLTERYLFIPEEIATYTYLGINGVDENNFTTAVAIKVYSSSYLMALYLSKEYLESKGSNIKQFKLFDKKRNEIENILPLKITE